ncbi:hypothetical protein GE107_07850 [Cohnella sp. CFH 77786]|uniref:hypothetical protein n=1 Tax=Cohnella sp. CFH 77786 TaxID=2662265 RepID=UPI001C60A32D|nr:hypothetical protein [Cohnella sp. CFH 77786]MBW5445972.1 hypothetical protein [Cohnella sp. CFH 77786]
MRRTIPFLLLMALLALLLSGCGNSQANDANAGGTANSGSISESPAAGSPSAGTGTVTTPASPSASEEPASSQSPAPESGADQALLRAARNVVDALRDRDLASLAEAADPQQGIRFSPYLHIDEKTSLVFKAGELPSFKDAKKLTWGSYDGSGEPIELTFRDYFEKFVYNQDFSGAPIVNVNKLAAKGTMTFNGPDVYPDASYVEFHFPGFDKKNEGMDWESLILVFRPSGQDWKLAAIVHGQWTI